MKKILIKTMKILTIIFIVIIILYIILIFVILIVDKIGYKEKCVKFSDGTTNCFDERLMEKGIPE